MKDKRPAVAPDLEKIGREAVAAMHLPENMKLEEDRVRQILSGRRERIWNFSAWAGVACAFLILCGVFMPDPGPGKVETDIYAGDAGICFDTADTVVMNTFANVQTDAAVYKKAVGKNGKMAASGAAVNRAARGRQASGLMKMAAPAAAPEDIMVEEVFTETAAADTEPEVAVEYSIANTETGVVGPAAAVKMKITAAPGEGFTDPAKEPLSTFSIESDSGSFQSACQLFRRGILPDPEDIRIEQFVNSPEYTGYPQPERDEVLKPFLTLAEHPFRPGRHILRAALQGSGEISGGGAPRFVIVCDESGSMAIGNAAAEAREFCDTLIGENENIAEIISVHDAFAQMWSTLDRCIELAETGSISVVLVSDLRWIPEKYGRDDLLKNVNRAREKGVRLNVVAFGTGSRDPVATEEDISCDQWAEALCEAGGGVYMRATDSRQALEMMHNEMQGRLQVIADDVKIQVGFDPAVVAGYRLLGYERRLMAAEDFRNEQVRAAPLARGGQVTAVYELLLHPGCTAGRAAVMTVRYREPGGLGFAERKCIVNAESRIDINTDSDFKAAAVIAEWAWGLRYRYANESAGTDVLLDNMPGGDSGRFAEYMELIRASR